MFLAPFKSLTYLFIIVNFKRNPKMPVSSSSSRTMTVSETAAHLSAFEKASDCKMVRLISIKRIGSFQQYYTPRGYSSAAATSPTSQSEKTVPAIAPLKVRKTVSNKDRITQSLPSRRQSLRNVSLQNLHLQSKFICERAACGDGGN